MSTPVASVQALITVSNTSFSSLNDSFGEILPDIYINKNTFRCFGYIILVLLGLLGTLMLLLFMIWTIYWYFWELCVLLLILLHCINISCFVLSFLHLALAFMIIWTFYLDFFNPLQLHPIKPTRELWGLNLDISYSFFWPCKGIHMFIFSFPRETIC